jgi:hypothetical protein
MSNGGKLSSVTCRSLLNSARSMRDWGDPTVCSQVFLRVMRIGKCMHDGLLTPDNLKTSVRNQTPYSQHALLSNVL